MPDPIRGGLSGATPSEAVSWGKISPDMLPGTVVCYGDTTVYLPLLAAYVEESDIVRKPKRLYDYLDSMMSSLRSDAIKE
ncbi:deoxyhypusine synthase family protein [Candidatus Omnitrophota bacterium]